MTQIAPVRANLTSSNQCCAEGRIVHATTPVLTMCRRLAAAGYDPDRPLHCYRDSMLCLIVRSIAIGTRLRVRGNGVGFEIIPMAARPAASPVRATALAGVR